MNNYRSLPTQSEPNSAIIQIPDFSQVGFDRAKAMELANLISVAYDEYEIWDTQQQEEPPNKIIGSGAYIDLPEGIECPQGSQPPPEKTPPPGSYGRLDNLWHSVPDQVKHYQRFSNFWFTEWWWLDAFKAENLGGILSTALTSLGHVFGSFEDLIKDDQLFGFIARSTERPNEIFVVFRGTRESAEWLDNFRPVQKPFLPELKQEFDDLGQVRNGFELIYSAHRANRFQSFLDHFKLQTHLDKSVKPTIKETITASFRNASSWLNQDTQIYVTGHSLGAALATLAAVHIDKLLKTNGLDIPVHLYTFASPRVGDCTFANHSSSIDAYRIINSEDLIQFVPLPTTKIFDNATLNGMSEIKKRRVMLSRELLKLVTKGQSEQQYQHVGLPITFTHQTGTIAGNHNHTKTYRQALRG
jgi:hypothetical protein